MPTRQVYLVLSTFKDARSAASAARKLVEQRLCACATLMPVRSIYSWKGGLEDQNECAVIFKTSATAKARLMKALASIHPYEVPEIVAIRAKDVSQPYLHWVLDSTKGVSQNRNDAA